MPVFDLLLAKLPAQLDQLAVSVGGKVDQSLERSLELDAHAVEAGHSLEQLELSAADRIPRLLMPVTVVGRSPRSLRLVLRDAGLVFKLRQ